MRFFNLVRGELKKIILRPSIFVLVGLLVLVVSINGFFYKSTNNSSTTIGLSGSSVSEIVTKWSGDGNYTKAYYLNKVTNAETGAGSFIANINATNSASQVLNEKCDSLETLLNEYKTAIDSENLTNMFTCSSAIKSKISELSAVYQNYINASKPQVLTSTSNYFKITNALTDSKNQLDSLNASSPVASHSFAYAQINTQKYFSKLKTNINNCKFVSLSDTLKTEVQSYYNKAIARLEVINTQITELPDSTKSADINNIKLLIAKYVDVTEQVNQAVSDSYYLNISDKLNEYYGFPDFNEYQTREECTKALYLLTNNSYSSNYAVAFNLSTNSNEKTNAFDFMFSTIQPVMFVIIVFLVIIASTSVGGEFSNGTIKLLLVRPYSRKKILSAKITASTIFASFFIFLSMLVSLIIGGIMFGFNSLPILCIFNSTTAFVIEPLVLTLILFICLVVKAIIYINLGVLVSALFKNSVGSIVLTMFIYFFGLIANMFFSGVSWFKFLPFSHFDLFNYFSPQIAVDQIQRIFVSGLNQSSIFISLGYSAVVLLILTVVSFEVFKRSDI